MGILFSVLVGTGILAAGGAGLYAGYQYFTNFQPGDKKLIEDLKKMKAELKPFIDDLIPWDEEELELLAINQVHRKIKKGIVSQARAVITSVYDELLIAWAYKRYASPKANAFIYARSSHFEFIYRIKKDETIIQVNNEPIGTLKAGGMLYSHQTKRLIARINKDPMESYFPIIIGDKEVANLINVNKATRTSSRAFEFISKMSKKEEAILLALAIYEMIQNELPAKKK